MLFRIVLNILNVKKIGELLHLHKIIKAKKIKICFYENVIVA